MTNPINQQFAPRQRVKFDETQGGPQAGVVIGILTNIFNGQATAAIEVDFAQKAVSPI